MNDTDILKHLKNAVDQAPVALLERIKQQTYEKMTAHDAITLQAKPSRFKALRSAMPLLTAAAVLLFAFVNWQVSTRWVDSKIYLDVNPSLEIETNRKDQVIRLSGINSESQALIADLDYKGKDLEVVAAELLDRLVLGDYLSSDHPAILLSVFNKRTEKRDQQLTLLDQAIHTHLQRLQIQPIVLSQPLDPTQTLTDYATEHQISVSKMTLIRNMLLIDPSLKVEDLVKLSLADLLKVSSKVRLDLDKIIRSADLERLKPEDEHETEKFEDEDEFEDELEDEHELENEIEAPEGPDDKNRSGSSDDLKEEGRKKDSDADDDDPENDAIDDD